MKKLATLFLTSTLLFGLFGTLSFSGTAKGYDGSEILDAQKNYSGPLTDDKGRTQKEAIEEFEDNLYIGDWVPCVKTEQDVKNMADNGIQFTYLWSFSYDKPESVEQLKWCMKYGVKVILIDGAITKHSWNENEKRTVEEYKEIIRPSVGNPYVLGYDLWDEPMSTHGNTDLINFVNNFKTAAAGTGLIPFVNLFPWSQPMWDKTYLDGSFEALGLDFVSVDIYPYFNVGELDYDTADYYLKDITAAGTAAREHQGDFWLFIQSMSFGAKRLPRMDELHQQAYVGLANGAKKLMNFCYSVPGGSEFVNSTAAVLTNGEKTPFYDTLQTFNREMIFLASYMKGFENMGVFTKIKGEIPETQPTLKEKLFGLYEEDYYINSVDSTDHLMVGKFENKTDGRKGVIFADISEVLENNGNVVTFKMPADRLTLIKDGKESVIYPDETGLYTLDLGNGGGAFVICEPQLTESEKELAEKVDEARKVLRDGPYAVEAVNLETLYRENITASLKEASALLDEALVSGNKAQIEAAADKLLRDGKEFMSYLDYYKRQAAPYLTLRKELTPSLFSEKTWSSFVKMTDNLATKCDTEDLNAYIGIKQYLNYAKNVTNRLEFVGLLGDCDLDGKITLDDAMLLVNTVAKKTDLTADISYIGDTDASKTIDLNDAMKVVMYVAKKIPSLKG